LKPLLKRLGKKDKNTLLLSLELLDSIVKNCKLLDFFSRLLFFS
jgi:hypothetical protein